MLSRRPIHPIFFGVYPVLSLYSLNTALVPASDVPIPLLVVLGSTCLAWLILALVTRSLARGAAGASVSIALVFVYGHVRNLLIQDPWLALKLSESSILLYGWCVVFLAGLILACWKWKKEEKIIYGLNIGGVVLASLPVLSIGASWYSSWHETKIAKSSPSFAKLNTTNRPDIYYVILDGFGRQDSLKRVIGLDDDFFIKGLESRGFFVANNCRSNYCQTELSLSSSLNLNYLTAVIPGLKATWDDRKILDRLIDKNEVADYLRRIGYRYEAITTGFPAVHPDSADLWLRRSLGMSLFSGVLLQEVPFSNGFGNFVGSQFEERRIMLKDAMKNLVKSANGGNEPRFIFAHILAPHPPFVFGPDGESIKPKRMGFGLVDGSDFMINGGTPAEYKTGYAGQATFVAKNVLDIVDQILATSKTTPIIIFQGDHGSKLKLDQEFLNKTDVNECFPNLNAFLVPPQVRANLYDGITPVNSFRMIFNGLFDDTFAKLPDRSYYSSWTAPFKFIDVTDRILPRQP